MYVYIRSEPGLWTVGFYGPSGSWHPDSDYNDCREAANRVHWLNGGCKLDDLQARVRVLEDAIKRAVDSATIEHYIF